MSQTIEIETVVQPDGTIVVRAPKLTPGQHVRLIISAEVDADITQGETILDVLNSLPGHQLFQSAEEVDAYTREERDSWER